MSNITVQSRVKPSTKRGAEKIFESIGISTSDAIRMFLKQTINVGGLPFKPVSKIPNAQTLQALKEAKNNELTNYNNADEVFASWDK